MPGYGTTVAVITAVNDQQVLEQNLLRSAMLADTQAQLIVESGYDSAARAYNAGARRVRHCADVLVFAHQDVYFPPLWYNRLLRAIDLLHHRRQPWGVLGVWGITRQGRCVGRVWCSGSNCEFRGSFEPGSDGLAEVASVDEIVIVTRADARLVFDEQLPGYHLYATDLVQQARKLGLPSYVFDAPVIHNSRTVPQLDQHYVQAYRYMQRKWQAQLPLQTCVLPVTRFGWPLRKYRMKAAINLLLRRVALYPRHDSPHQLARQLGYET